MAGDLMGVCGNGQVEIVKRRLRPTPPGSVLPRQADVTRAADWRTLPKAQAPHPGNRSSGHARLAKAASQVPPVGLSRPGAARLSDGEPVADGDDAFGMPDPGQQF